jgi:hypothetical protein
VTGGPGSGVSDDPRRVVERILLSPYFQERELSEILLYICYQTQNGNVDALHEHDIGVAVLGLEPGYDVRENTTVADAVEKIRQGLKLYFANEGRREPVRVAIPRGEVRAFFYEADPRQLAEAEEPTALERFWGPYWGNQGRNLLVHGELPNEAMPIAEAYAATQIAVLFAHNGSGLQLRPVSEVTDTDLRMSNLIVIGSPETNPLLAQFLDTYEEPVVERLPRDGQHGMLTALTAPTAEGLLEAAAFACSEEHLARHEYPAVFRIRLYGKS